MSVEYKKRTIKNFNFELNLKSETFTDRYGNNESVLYIPRAESRKMRSLVPYGHRDLSSLSRPERPIVEIAEPVENGREYGIRITSVQEWTNDYARYYFGIVEGGEKLGLSHVLLGKTLIDPSSGEVFGSLPWLKKALFASAVLVVIFSIVGNAALMTDLTIGSNPQVRFLMALTEFLTVAFMVVLVVIILSRQSKGMLFALLCFSLLIMFLDRLTLSIAYTVASYA